MDGGATFTTQVKGIWGYWPDTPHSWSYSSLRDLESCPRRWMLSRATYPDLWDHRGYPAQPAVAALFGNIVHGVIERLGEALANNGIDAVTHGVVVRVIGDLGGWRGIVTKEIDYHLAHFEGNPRVSAERLDRVRDELLRRVSQAADQVKVFLGRGAIPDGPGQKTDNALEITEEKSRRFAASLGTHAEREVGVEALRLTGRIDLLVIDATNVTIVDFKTGVEDVHHDDQVRLYALLWALDTETNPEHRPATKLEIAYPSHTRTVSSLNRVEFQAFYTSILDRVADADSITAARTPPAMPSLQTCQYCQVRHLCEAYWSTIPTSVTQVRADEWFDFEGRVIKPHGSRSWIFESADTSADVLVRTVDTNLPFPEGDKVRLLGVRRIIDPDDEDRIVVSMVSTSEWYPLTS